jgi:hypothetical protein
MAYTPNPFVATVKEAAVLAAVDSNIGLAYTDGVKLIDRSLTLNGHVVTVTIDNIARTVTFTSNTAGDFASVQVNDALEITGPPFSDVNAGYFKVTSASGIAVTCQRLAGMPFQCLAEVKTITNNAQVVAFTAIPPMPGYNTSAASPYLDVIKGTFKAALIVLLRSLSLLPDSWTAPTLGGGWSNYGSGYSTAGYYKDPFGTVHLKGVIAGGTTTNTTVYTLPAGYRPLEKLILTSTSYTGAAYVFTRIDIDTGGNVIVVTGSNNFLSFDGLSFRAEQ